MLPVTSKISAESQSAYFSNTEILDLDKYALRLSSETLTIKNEWVHFEG